MNINLVWVLRKIARKFNYDIKPYYEVNESLLKFLKQHNINLIFDIGAFEGKYTQNLFSLGYKGKAISIEPQEKYHKKLLKLSQTNNNWIIHKKCAVGANTTESFINISGSPVSSSLLPMLKTHTDASPGSGYSSKERVQIYTLDDIVTKYLKNDSRIFLKLDVQGAEWQVLKGGLKTIKTVKGIQIETSLVPLYKGEKLISEMLDYFQNLGFNLYDVIPGFRNKNTGRLLQVDLIFFRDN